MARRPPDLYELWDFESRNLLGAYATEDEALAIVRATIDEYGMENVRRWGLGHDRRGKLISLLEGDALAQHAVAATGAGTLRSGAAD
jgi:hypothetical protein